MGKFRNGIGYRRSPVRSDAGCTRCTCSTRDIEQYIIFVWLIVFRVCCRMRLIDPRSFQLGSAHFLITAVWQVGSTSSNLGFLSTLFAASGIDPAFQAGSAGSGSGQLAITVRTARNGIGWPGPALPASPAARFPGAVLTVRAARTGAVHTDDGLYVYLPAGLLSPGDGVTYFVADDGSTYTSPDLEDSTLARSAEGQMYPPRASNPSTAPALTFRNLNRRPGAMVLTDPERFVDDAILVEAALFTGSNAFQTLGGIPTTQQAPGVDPDLQAPDPWPAYSFAPSKKAVSGDIPTEGLLSILLRPLSGDFIPPAELVLQNRSGQSLLVYLPEVATAPSAGVRLLVADDGSTYFAPTDPSVQLTVIQQQSFSALVLARAALGQALAIPGRWPLQQRVPVALDLCRNERASLLAVGELGIDPELGRFALPPQDPALTAQQGTAIDRSNVSVDFVEAFPDLVGALNSTQREIDPAPATRFVSRSGDVASAAADALAGAPVHASVAEAVAAAQDGDVVEIADSSTYEAPAGVVGSGCNQKPDHSQCRWAKALPHFVSVRGSGQHRRLRGERADVGAEFEWSAVQRWTVRHRQPDREVSVGGMHPRSIQSVCSRDRHQRCRFQQRC